MAFRGLGLGCALLAAFGGLLPLGSVAAQQQEIPRLVARPLAARPLPAAAQTTTRPTPTEQANEASVIRDEAVRPTAANDGDLQWQRRSTPSSQGSQNVQLGAPRNSVAVRPISPAPRVAQGGSIQDPFGDRDRSSDRSAPATTFASRRYQEEAGDVTGGVRPGLGMAAPQADAFDCEAFYDKLAQNKLSNIDLNFSPTIAPKAQSAEEVQAALERTLAEQMPVDWIDRTGRVVAQGRLADWHNGIVYVLGNDNQEYSVPFYELSASSRAVVTRAWQVPTECALLEQGSVEREWMYQTYTWTASNLCHKPLFFEDVQLERYGQTSRPLVQPFRSGAHFFLNIAAMPYNAGVYPPNECRYALGYYRPGDCAPYLGKTLPLSLRGAVFQAGAAVAAPVLLP